MEDEEKDNKEEEYNQIENSLLEGDEKKRQQEMKVSGKSVFDLQRIKNKKLPKNTDK